MQWYYDIFVAGDSCNEVLTGVRKLGFNPDLYQTNALQGMAYDPSGDTVRYTDISCSSLCIGPFTKSVVLRQVIRAETARYRERLRTQVRQRRLTTW